MYMIDIDLQEYNHNGSAMIQVNFKLTNVMGIRLVDQVAK